MIDDSIKSIESNLLAPTGRDPEKDSLELSNWFNKLRPEDKVIVMKIVKESIETSVFGFLCVLDGVRAIEDSKIKAGYFYLTKSKEI